MIEIVLRSVREWCAERPDRFRAYLIHTSTSHRRTPALRIDILPRRRVVYLLGELPLRLSTVGRFDPSDPAFPDNLYDALLNLG